MVIPGPVSGLTESERLSVHHGSGFDFSIQFYYLFILVMEFGNKAALASRCCLFISVV